MIKTAFDSLLSVVYPQECRICRNSVENSDDGVVCSECWDDAKFISESDTLCSKCGDLLAERPSNVAAFCRNCVDHSYDSASAAGIYRGGIAASIVHLKQRPEISKRLAKAFEITAARLSKSDRTLIVPVPLSTERLRERGFNQAAVLAQIASLALDCGVDESSLVRVTHTIMHQTGMDEKARHLRVAKAFDIKRPKLISGRDVILMDDVLTSGATVSHCAKALKKSGAASVRVLTLARAVKSF